MAQHVRVFSEILLSAQLLKTTIWTTMFLNVFKPDYELCFEYENISQYREMIKVVFLPFFWFPQTRYGFNK